MFQSIDRTGVFVTLEGPDGAGKSSQAARLAERLRAAGYAVVLTREPGGTALGERIRGLLLDAAQEGHHAISDALLFNAARRALVDEVIGPALARGDVIICDRYADSTLAYQGHGGGAPLDALRALADIATDGLRPDRTLLFDLPVEAGLARRRGGSTAELTRFEVAQSHDRAFHERVRHGFRELAAAEPDRWRVIDASVAPEEVAAAAWAALVDLFPAAG